MAQTVTLPINLGSSKTGLTDLRAQPLTAAGASTGSAISTGFSEIGRGMYQFTGDVPDDAASVKAYSLANSTTVLDHIVLAPYLASSSGGSNTGPGASETTVRVLVAGSPVADADVWITSDADGETVVAGTLQTDSAGEAVFMLDEGVTYYLWAQKDGVNAIRGESFEAE